jgi:hypothetical protein
LAFYAAVSFYSDKNNYLCEGYSNRIEQ